MVAVLVPSAVGLRIVASANNRSVVGRGETFDKVHEGCKL